MCRVDLQSDGHTVERRLAPNHLKRFIDALLDTFGSFRLKPGNIVSQLKYGEEGNLNRKHMHD